VGNGSEPKIRNIGIAGAGLSGLVLADLILENNTDVNVDIFERQDFESYGVDCAGGFADPRGVADFVDRHFPIDENIKPYAVNDIERSVWTFDVGKRRERVEILHPQLFWILDRLELQLDLIKRVRDKGATVIFGEKANPELMSYDLSVDARGPHSRLGEYSLSIYSIFEGDFNQDTAYFHHEEGFDGYYWIFPLSEDRANIGCGSFSKPYQINKKMLEQFAEDRVKDVKRVGDVRTAPVSHSSKDLVGNSPSTNLSYNLRYIAKIGDAAGMADPFSSEGIIGSISSAIALSLAVERNDPEVYPELLPDDGMLKLREEIASLRRENFEKFVDVFKCFDGIREEDIRSKYGFALKHPIKSIKLTLTL